MEGLDLMEGCSSILSNKMMERFLFICQKIIERLWSILYKLGGRSFIIPHELIEGFLFILHGSDERVAIIPFEIDRGIGFDGGVLIDSLQ